MEQSTVAQPRPQGKGEVADFRAERIVITIRGERVLKALEVMRVVGGWSSIGQMIVSHTLSDLDCVGDWIRDQVYLLGEITEPRTGHFEANAIREIGDWESRVLETIDVQEEHEGGT